MWSILTMPTLIFLATPLLAYREISQKANLVQEGRRNFLNTPKCAQWPHLYTTYEAIYGLKCLVFEKLAKNWFLHDRVAKNHNFRYTIVSHISFCLIQTLEFSNCINSFKRYLCNEPEPSLKLPWNENDLSLLLNLIILSIVPMHIQKTLTDLQLIGSQYVDYGTTSSEVNIEQLSEEKTPFWVKNFRASSIVPSSKLESRCRVGNVITTNNYNTLHREALHWFPDYREKYQAELTSTRETKGHIIIWTESLSYLGTGHQVKHHP